MIFRCGKKNEDRAGQMVQRWIFDLVEAKTVIKTSTNSPHRERSRTSSPSQRNQ